jgi:hypothetical protein
MFATMNVIEPAVPDDLSIRHCPRAANDINNWCAEETPGIAALAVVIEGLDRGQAVQCRTTHVRFVTPALLRTYPASNGPQGHVLEALLLPTMTGGLVASVHRRMPGLIDEALYGKLTNRVICSYQNYHIARSSRGGLQPGP